MRHNFILYYIWAQLVFDYVYFTVALISKRKRLKLIYFSYAKKLFQGTQYETLANVCSLVTFISPKLAPGTISNVKIVHQVSPLS